jgi:hypothetical protein
MHLIPGERALLAAELAKKEKRKEYEKGCLGAFMRYPLLDPWCEFSQGKSPPQNLPTKKDMKTPRTFYAILISCESCSLEEIALAVTKRGLSAYVKVDRVRAILLRQGYSRKPTGVAGGFAAEGARIGNLN